VVQAAAIGESGQVLVLDMGEPVRIIDLAKDMIRLAGHTLDEIAIVFSGLRPGEKLYEELLAGADTTLPTRIESLRVARLNGRGGAPLPSVLSIEGLALASASATDPRVRQWLGAWVREYRPATERRDAPAR
jgi:FlaA1/EpsC-like NDP-sugar epimerase